MTDAARPKALPTKRKLVTQIASPVDHPWGVHEFLEINPMNQRVRGHLENMRGAPRCGAKTRAGSACQSPAINGRKRCRLHGGLSPGAPRGPRNGNYRDGSWTLEALEERQWLRSLVSTFAKPESTS
jgi:hypothetical protein